MVSGRYGVKLYCDTGNLSDFERETCEGFTTNPSLCKAAGVTDYGLFCRDAAEAAMGRPVSLEVTASTRDDILRQAHLLAAHGSHVYVKVPECDAHGHSHVTLIKRLVDEGVRVNVTAVLDVTQVEGLLPVLDPQTLAIVSIFCGRIADTGRDPTTTIRRAAHLLRHHRKTKLLWASTRECWNIVQAEEAGADVVTVSPALLDKWKTMKGTGLRALAAATVRQFEADAREAGFTL